MALFRNSSIPKKAPGDLSGSTYSQPGGPAFDPPPAGTYSHLPTCTPVEEELFTREHGCGRERRSYQGLEELQEESMRSAADLAAGPQAVVGCNLQVAPF